MTNHTNKGPVPIYSLAENVFFIIIIIIVCSTIFYDTHLCFYFMNNGISSWIVNKLHKGRGHICFVTAEFSIDSSARHTVVTSLDKHLFND